jgi:hypothetical protein
MPNVHISGLVCSFETISRDGGDATCWLAEFAAPQSNRSEFQDKERSVPL